MSNAMKSLIAAAVHTFLAGMYYLWQIKGVEQAGNVFIFYVWFIGIAGTLTVFIPATANDYTPRTPIQRVIRFAVTPLVLVGTLWAGHIFAASVYAIAVLAAEVRHKEAKKLAEANA